MNLLVLGRGKTGSLVAQAARDRGHQVRVVGADENVNGCALGADQLRDVDAVLDFTVPAAVAGNISACARARKNMVVGTTGWYEETPAVKKLVADSGIGFLYAANFSLGVNLFLEIARTAAASLEHGYFGQIFERHHAQKKDAPSGTAIALRNAIRDTARQELEIISFREGDVVGQHEVILESPSDTIYLCHDAKNRLAFAEGAVRGAEWIANQKGFYNFAEVWRQV